MYVVIVPLMYLICSEYRSTGSFGYPGLEVRKCTEPQFSRVLKNPLPPTNIGSFHLSYYKTIYEMSSSNLPKIERISGRGSPVGDQLLF